MSADKTEIDEMHKWLYELESRRYSLHDIAEKILDRQERREHDIRRYAEHRPGCTSKNSLRSPCSCGLDRLLARLDGKGKVN